MKTFKKFLYLLSPNEKKLACLLFVMTLIMALLDMIGVASILPFMAVLTNPEIIQTNNLLNNLFEFSKRIGVENNQHFLIVMGILVFALLIISLAFKACTTYVQMRFAQMREYSIGKRLVEGYLRQSYSWFLNRHSADFGKIILSEVNKVIFNGLYPLMDMIAKGLITIAIVSLLFIADPKLAIIVGASLCVAYGLTYQLMRKYLIRIGKETLKSNKSRFIAISEAFGAIKEVKVSGLEQIFVKRFSDPAKNFAQNQTSAAVIRELPRYVLEAIAFGGIMLVLLYMMIKVGSLNNVLPLISLYVLAGYRLLPAVQIVYSSFTAISFIGPSLDKLYDDIKSLDSIKLNHDNDLMLLNKSIDLKNISYNYPNTSRTALKNININIPANSTVGLIGTTGSGKTTTVDIILGLLKPQKGTLEVDGKIILENNHKAWQRSIGYVPQNIYLADDTIAANIAFGVNPENIKEDLVEKASKIANLHDFVIDELPDQYQTIIGERGVRLSGGQRQRIGIARALYYNPNILIFDEATNALDNFTEKAVMDAVNNIGNNKTIIIIAHRLSTVKKCDNIFILKKGKIENQGSFEELTKVNKNLKMADNIN
jgi:ATP-binding cassette, subfamily B, bacterial PglK